MEHLAIQAVGFTGSLRGGRGYATCCDTHAADPGIRRSIARGGPYPATSDSRGTSVGTLAIDRFLRPVCHQNFPEALLPDA